MKHQCDFCFWPFCYIFTFFSIALFSTCTRARYVMFLLCAFILCSSSWEMARKVSIQQLWYDYAHEIFFWVFIILKAGHFCWFFFILITGIRYHNSINWITLAYDLTKRNSTKELTWVFFVRPFVNRIPCDTVFIVVWALVFQFVKTLETIKNVTMDEWMKQVRIWWTVIVKHLNIKPNNNCQIQKNRQWNVYS